MVGSPYGPLYCAPLRRDGDIIIANAGLYFNNKTEKLAGKVSSMPGQPARGRHAHTRMHARTLACIA